LRNNNMEVIQTPVISPSEDPRINLDVTKAIDGDTAAFGRIYTLFVDRIYRYVYYLLGNRMMAEDITEEVFIKAWKSIGNCRGREQTFSSWLFRIAHNHSVTMVSKNHREIPVADVHVTDKHDPQIEAEENLDLQNVLEAVKSLPESQKQVIILKFLDDIENDEIGRILGKRQGAIRALQMRALNSLRKKFSGGEGAYDK
jgi:RNA polymerase sigma-70 factor, ECF subfamily